MKRIEKPTTLGVVLVLFSFSAIAPLMGCQSGITSDSKGAAAVNPAMSEKQKAIIQKHHQDQ